MAFFISPSSLLLLLWLLLASSCYPTRLNPGLTPGPFFLDGGRGCPHITGKILCQRGIQVISGGPPRHLLLLLKLLLLLLLLLVLLNLGKLLLMMVMVAVMVVLGLGGRLLPRNCFRSK